jgi:hypothetical protein
MNEQERVKKMACTNGEEVLNSKIESRGQLSGLEYMQKLAGGELPQSGMAQLMGFRLVEASEGYAVVTVKPAEQHYNGIG